MVLLMVNMPDHSGFSTYLFLHLVYSDGPVDVFVTKRAFDQTGLSTDLFFAVSSILIVLSSAFYQSGFAAYFFLCLVNSDGPVNVFVKRAFD